MCENINRFVEENHSNIALISNSQYGRTLNPNIGLDTWGVPVEQIVATRTLIDAIKKYNIKRIWYMGIHWNRCIRHRQTGYNSVKESLTRQGLDVTMYAVQNCTLENVKDGNELLYERVPNFANDPVTDLVQVNDRDWQILGTRKDWNGKI